MKKLETLAISSNAINKQISADIKGNFHPRAVPIDEKSFEVCIYPNKDNDSLLVKIGNYSFTINPNNEDEYKSEDGIEYINCETDIGTVRLQIANIQGE